MMSQQEYKVLIQGLKGLRKLVPINKDIYDVIGDRLNTDWYQSIFRYSQSHFEHLNKTKSLAGITDVYTNTLVWDLDSHTDINTAKKDAINLCNTLINIHKVPESSIQVAFSGRKGFSITVHTTDKFTVEEFKSINRALAANLTTNDPVVADPQRIFRVLGTKHNVTGLHKFPLTVTQLNTLTMSEIQKLAEDINNADPNLVYFDVCKTPASILALRKVKVEVKPVIKDSLDLDEIDFTKKPKGFTNCRFAIMNGVYPAGNRNNSLMALAAACRAQNYPKEIAYNVCKGSIRLQSQRYGQEPFPKDELWKNIIEQVYGETWNGGAFSCKKEGWLQDFCNTLGEHKCNHKEVKDDLFIEMKGISNNFNLFATEFEKNKITTGIEELDQKVTLCTSMLVGLLANPGTGKTTLALNILNHTNKSNLNTIFYSMDMGVPLVYLRMIQKHFSIPMEKVIEIYKNDPEKVKEFNDVLSKEYSNVKFSFKAGLTVEQIRDGIYEQERSSGQKVKLVVVDYLECIAGPYSDATANTAIIANQLKDIANETETCILLLLQTQKHGGAPDEPLLSMKNIKGSSVIEQACSVILTIWREGYNPKYSDRDNFLSIATVKNRLNTLWKQDFHWTGINGTIRDLFEEEKDDLAELRQMKMIDKSSDNNY